MLHFREAMLWFGGLVALVATLQTFTGEGKIFWLFAVPYSEKAMGPILSYNHYAAFIELLLPLAIYQALRSKERDVYKRQESFLARAGMPGSSEPSDSLGACRRARPARCPFRLMESPL